MTGSDGDRQGVLFAHFEQRHVYLDYAMWPGSDPPIANFVGSGDNGRHGRHIAIQDLAFAADWGVAIEPVARAYGLAFPPLRAERYDFTTYLPIAGIVPPSRPSAGSGARPRPV